MEHPIDKDHVTAKHKQDLELKIKPLTQAIIESSFKSKENTDNYIKKIAVDIIVHCSLGDPSKPEVYIIFSSNSVQS